MERRPDVGIEIEGLVKRYRTGTGTFTAVDHVSFSVSPGQMVALLGPSGSGKSTVLRIIAGLEPPDAGRIMMHGRDVTRIRAQDREIGFVFQHYALFRNMTVWKNIAFGLEVNRWPKDEIAPRVDHCLELVQLKGYEKRYPNQLSGGQRQRVALARALAPRPSFLLLDEPFGALDAKVRRNLAIQLRELHQAVDTTSIFVTHDQAEAFELADRIVVINRGRVEQVGSARDIYDRPAGRFVASFIGNVNMVECDSDGHHLWIGPRRRRIRPGEPPGNAGSLILLIRPEGIETADSDDPSAIPVRLVNALYRGDRYEIVLDMDGVELRMMVDRERGTHREWTRGEILHVRLARYTLFDADEGHDVLREKLKTLGYIE